MSTVAHPPEMQEFWSPHGTLGRPLRGLQPQTKIPLASNLIGLGVSTITHRQESKKRQDHHSMDCNTKVQFQMFRIVVVMVYQPTTSSYKSQNYLPRMG